MNCIRSAILFVLIASPAVAQSTAGKTSVFDALGNPVLTDVATQAELDAAVLSGGGVTLTSTYVGYGSGGNTVTGEAAFNYNAGQDTLSVGTLQLGSGSSIFSTATPTIKFSNLVDSEDITLAIGLAGNNIVLLESATGINLFDFGTVEAKVPQEVYDATGWNGDLTVPTKDAVRDVIETKVATSGVVIGTRLAAYSGTSGTVLVDSGWSQGTLRDRANHTGTQAVGTITGLAAIATSGSATDLTAGTVAAGRLGSGTPTASTYLNGLNQWVTPTGTGDVVGPSTAVTDGRVVLFDATTGKLLKQGTILGTDIPSKATANTFAGFQQVELDATTDAASWKRTDGTAAGTRQQLKVELSDNSTVGLYLGHYSNNGSGTQTAKNYLRMNDAGISFDDSSVAKQFHVDMSTKTAGLWTAAGGEQFDGKFKIGGTLATTTTNGRVMHVSTTAALGNGFAMALYDASGGTTGTNNLDHIATYQARQIHASSGTLTDNYGFVAIGRNDGGTITNNYGLKVFDQQGVGAITNNYGVYINDLTRGTNDYAVYTAGTTPSYFGGTVTSNTGFSGSGASLTSLNASNITTGTLPDAQFPATLPAVSGANLTNLDAADLATGTIPVARIGTGDIGPTQLAATAVAAGAYTSANITVDADGRITAASNGSGGSGSVATDTIFDAKGDLPVGTAADTAAKLTVGANNTALIADSSTATGLKWAPLNDTVDYDKWHIGTYTFTSNTTIVGTNIISASASGTATADSDGSSTRLKNISYASAATTGSDAGFASNGGISHATHDWDVRWTGGIDTLTDVRWIGGLGEGISGVAAADLPAGSAAAWFRYSTSASDTNFQCLSDDDAAGSATITNSGVTATTGQFRFRITKTATAVTFFINGTQVAQHTATAAIPDKDASTIFVHRSRTLANAAATCYFTQAEIRHRVP